MISWLSSTRERKLQEEIDRLRRDLIEAQIKLSKCVDENIDLFTKLNRCTIELQKQNVPPQFTVNMPSVERKKPGPKPKARS